jgi:hypothetical protein
MYKKGLIDSAKLLELKIKHRFWPIGTNGVIKKTYRLSQGSTKVSGLLFGPSVSFATISDSRKGSQSLVNWPYKSKLQASLPWS